MPSNKSRPAFNELCDCVAVVLSEGQQREMDRRYTSEGRQALIRQLYENGKEYTVQSNCSICGGTGIQPVQKEQCENTAGVSRGWYGSSLQDPR
jgi:hypothetical protein